MKRIATILALLAGCSSSPPSPISADAGADAPDYSACADAEELCFDTPCGCWSISYVRADGSTGVAGPFRCQCP